VVIALSEEMQRHLVDVPDLPRVPVRAPVPDPQAIAELPDLLAQSRKPLVILGGSTWTAEGRAAIQHFAGAWNLPVAVGFRRQALYDGTLDNFVGDLGVGSDPALVARAKEADLILAIGTRLGEAVTQGYTLFDKAGFDKAGGTRIVHVYPEQAEIGRVYRVALGIAGDVNAFAHAAAAFAPKPGAWSDWTASLRKLREAGREVPEQTGLNIGRVMRELEELAAPDAVFTSDAGNFATWPARFINFKDGQRFIGPTNGAMGYGVPAGVGAAIAYPGRQAIIFVGDGGMLMTGTEIATAFHHGVAPIVLVFNNAMYGTIRMYQERTYPGRVSGTLLTNPDFSAFMQSFGGHGEVVEHNDEFAPAFRRAVASGKPALIELRQNPEQITSRATITQLRAGTGVVKAERN
jgi:acetolactate synthase-1/2/3 large subunit